jgi:hypothetical protein
MYALGYEHIKNSVLRAEIDCLLCCAVRTESSVAKLISRGRFFVALLSEHADCDLTDRTSSRFGTARYITD